MNIFILDLDPVKNAQYHCDRHVNKMILESAQMLCTVLEKQGITTPYRPCHQNHPCTLWAEASLLNWKYLRLLAIELNEEKVYRYGRDHKSIDVILSLPQPELPNIGMTPFAQAMPDEYKNDDPVQAYRDYYNGAKSHLFKWTKRSVPFWAKTR